MAVGSSRNGHYLKADIQATASLVDCEDECPVVYPNSCIEKTEPLPVTVVKGCQIEDACECTTKLLGQTYQVKEIDSAKMEIKDTILARLDSTVHLDFSLKTDGDESTTVEINFMAPNDSIIEGFPR